MKIKINKETKTAEICGLVSHRILTAPLTVHISLMLSAFTTHLLRFHKLNTRDPQQL